MSEELARTYWSQWKDLNQGGGNTPLLLLHKVFRWRMSMRSTSVNDVFHVESLTDAMLVRLHFRDILAYGFASAKHASTASPTLRDC